MADKSLLASYADNSNTVTAKHVELASRETEFVSKQQWPAFRWGMACLSVFILAAVIMNINVIKQSFFSVEEPGATKTVDVAEEDVAIVATKTSAPSLMLVKEVREEINSNNGKSKAAEKSTAFDKVDNQSRVATSDDLTKELVAQQDTAVIIKPEWQKIEQVVYFYPDAKDELIDPVKDLDTRNSELLEIRDLIEAVSDHGNKDKMTLMNQLTILPSETAINHESVASDLTCKLCSTIIYRPLTDGKKL